MIRTSIALALLVFCAAAPARADGTWQTPDTLAGFLGTYSRYDAAAPGEIVYVGFSGSDGYRASGSFTRFVAGAQGGVTLQSGHFEAIGNNPAIGAIISFWDAQGGALDSYWILGIRRDPLGKKIVALQLAAPDGKTIVLYRVGS